MRLAEHLYMSLEPTPVAREQHRLGNERLVQGQFEQALTCYDQALAVAPSFAAAWCNRGVALHEMGRLLEALKSHHQALSLNARDATSWLNCGNTLRAMGQTQDAVNCFDQALRISPGDAHTLYARGTALVELQRPEEALSDLEAATLQLTDWPDAHMSYGSALMELHRYHDALAAFAQAQQLAPCSAQGFFNCGCALNALRRPQEALACFERAGFLGDQRAELHLNQGFALTELDRWPEAVQAFRAAIQREPTSAAAWSNLGLALDRTKAFEEARSCHQQAMVLDPGYAPGRYNASFFQLRMGEYLQGFELYEARWQTRDFERRQRQVHLPLWRGEPLQPGQGLLVFAEQGFGDTIQFSRFLGKLVDRGVSVTLQVPARLVAMFDGQWTGVPVLPDGAPPPEHMVARCPLMSLPHILGTTLDDIPRAEGYLRAKHNLALEWHQRVTHAVGEQSGLRVGLMWRGGEATRYRNRSLTWAALNDLLMSRCSFVSLQKELVPDEAPLVMNEPRIRHFGEEQHSFADAAALIQTCDLVITVDTSVAHLSGALGRPTWVLLPYDADWRWLEDRSDSPWYSSMRLYRQGTDASWEPVLTRVAHDLAQLCASPN